LGRLAVNQKARMATASHEAKTREKKEHQFIATSARGMKKEGSRKNANKKIREDGAMLSSTHQRLSKALPSTRQGAHGRGREIIDKPSRRRHRVRNTRLSSESRECNSRPLTTKPNIKPDGGGLLRREKSGGNNTAAYRGTLGSAHSGCRIRHTKRTLMNV